MNKLKNKMIEGAKMPGKFAVAEAAMASGGLIAPAADSSTAAANAPSASAPSKLPLGAGRAVRESISLLPEESQIIDGLRMKMAATGFIYNRSEILRAGILSLKDMNPSELEALLGDVPKLKPGRPN